MRKVESNDSGSEGGKERKGEVAREIEEKV